MERGWRVTAEDSGTLMERYGRPPSETAATPRTVFVHGELG
jgi:hypothetical protein